MRIRHATSTIVPLFLVVLWGAVPTSPLQGQTTGHVVISEIYGGGGNSGSTYTHDFIELYNPTASDIGMSNWSVQYQSGGGSGPFTAIAKFSGTIRARRFFLIQANPGSGGVAPLPKPDAVAGFALAASSGKVALCSDTVPAAGPASPGVVDFVGYGTSNLFEGTAPAAAAGNAVSVERKASAGSDDSSMSAGGSEEHSGNGRDSDDNGNDFIRRGPEPQNDSSAAESPGGTLSLSAVYARRWNLVSLPLDVPNPAAAALFPGAQTPLYAYRSGYVGESTAVRGQGYWVRFAAPETVSFTGTPVDHDTIDLIEGWNLVGSAADPVAAADVLQLPAGHLTSGFYAYDEGYRAVDTLRPGYACWVRSSTGGKIVLTAGPAAVDPTDRGGVFARGSRPSLHAGPGPGTRGVQPGPDLPPPPPGAYLPAAPVQNGPGPDGPSFSGAWPNPFNPVTRIVFSLPSAGPVDVDVVDLSGRVVAVLLHDRMTAGEHSVEWDARRGDGMAVSGGIYLVRLRTGGAVVTRKLVYLR